MNSSLRNRVQKEAYYLVLLQLAGVCFLALMGLLFFSANIGLSILAGGLAYSLPNLIFVWRVFRYVGAQQMTRFMTAFFFGEMLKLIFSGIFVLMVVKTMPISLSSVLVGFAGAIVSFWLACMWYFSQQSKQSAQQRH